MPKISPDVVECYALLFFALSHLAGNNPILLCIVITPARKCKHGCFKYVVGQVYDRWEVNCSGFFSLLDGSK